MAFKIITDTTSNLDVKLATEKGISLIPFSYFINDKDYTCFDLDEFNDAEYYNSIRNGSKVTTSQVNPQCYIDFMTPFLEDSLDILFIGLSSGISGSFSSAQMAREQLLEDYPDRKIHLIDSLGAGLGEGLLAINAAECRDKNMDVDQTFEYVSKIRDSMYQVFTVDDLMHLKRTGRLSNMGAFMGTVLGIKPLLKGNEEGKIVAFKKLRGRKQAIKEMAEKYKELAVNPETQLIGISHADCVEDANYLIELLKENTPPKDILLVKHEPVTGSHIGPGALALFFVGSEDVRTK